MTRGGGAQVRDFVVRGLASGERKRDTREMSLDPPKSGFAPLPRMRTRSGEERRVGVEIEFAGLTEHEAAQLAQDGLGGRISERDDHRVRLGGTALGDLTIELDTALKAWGGTPLVDAGLDAARGLIPVEIVTEPLDWRGLERLDAFRETLRQAGAIGTRDGMLLGFGVHFNVAVTALEDTYTADTIRAFGLLEDWLRARFPVDRTRRLMPFVEPWPRAFVTAIAGRAGQGDMDEIRSAYAEHCNSRNYALDLLPLFEVSDPASFARLFPDQTNTKGRPAFHYRLPDSRIDEPDWSLSQEWERWHIVERLADTPGLLDALANAFLDRKSAVLGDRDTWAKLVGDRLKTAGFVAGAD